MGLVVEIVAVGSGVAVGLIELGRFQIVSRQQVVLSQWAVAVVCGLAKRVYVLAKLGLVKTKQQAYELAKP